jgi:hypothetical protein
MSDPLDLEVTVRVTRRSLLLAIEALKTLCTIHHARAPHLPDSAARQRELADQADACAEELHEAMRRAEQGP